MGRRAGLHLEAHHLAVELQQSDGVVDTDQILHVLGLGLGLEGVVPVQVVTAGGVTGDIHAAFHVLLGNQDEEDVVQQVVHLDGIGLAGVVVVKAGDLAGLLDLVFVSNAGVRQDAAQEGGHILDELGGMQAQGFPLLGQLLLTGLGQIGELLVVDGILFHQHLGKLQDAVGGRDLVGVDVGVQDGNLIVQLVCLDVGQNPFGVGLGPLTEVQPVLDGVAVLGHDQVGHVVTQVGLAHALLYHIGLCGLVVVVAQAGQTVQLSVNLPHGVEGFIGLNDDGAVGGQLFAVYGSHQIEFTADVQIAAAVGVGDAGVAAAHHGVAGQLQGHGALAVGGLHALHGEVAGVCLRNLCQIDGIGLVGVHLSLAQQGEEALAGVGVGGSALQGPGNGPGLGGGQIGCGQLHGHFHGVCFTEGDEGGLGLRCGVHLNVGGQDAAGQQHGQGHQGSQEAGGCFAFHDVVSFLSFACGDGDIPQINMHRTLGYGAYLCNEVYIRMGIMSIVIAVTVSGSGFLCG